MCAYNVPPSVSHFNPQILLLTVLGFFSRFVKNKLLFLLQCLQFSYTAVTGEHTFIYYIDFDSGAKL